MLHMVWQGQSQLREEPAVSQIWHSSMSICRTAAWHFIFISFHFPMFNILLYDATVSNVQYIYFLLRHCRCCLQVQHPVPHLTLGRVHQATTTANIMNLRVSKDKKYQPHKKKYISLETAVQGARCATLAQRANCSASAAWSRTPECLRLQLSVASSKEMKRGKRIFFFFLVWWYFWI